MARPSQKDPLDKFRWTVEIEGFTKLGFSTCGTPSIVYNTKSYAEGGAHYHPKKIVDSVEYKPVTLSRGVTTDESFMKWIRQAIELHRGRSDDPTTVDQGIEETNELFQALNQARSALNPAADIQPLNPAVKIPLEYRREVRINHINRSGETVKTYVLYNAFPVEFTPASDFASDADDVLSMETLVLAYEGFEVITNSTDSNPFDIKDAAKRLIRRF